MASLGGGMAVPEYAPRYHGESRVHT
jgi:hypothetical protein